MNKKSLICLSISLLLILSLAPSALCGMLYAYAPMNAVTAEPDTPYNLDAIPEVLQGLLCPMSHLGAFC